MDGTRTKKQGEKGNGQDLLKGMTDTGPTASYGSTSMTSMNSSNQDIVMPSPFSHQDSIEVRVEEIELSQDKAQKQIDYKP